MALNTDDKELNPAKQLYESEKAASHGEPDDNPTDKGSDDVKGSSAALNDRETRQPGNEFGYKPSGGKLGAKSPMRLKGLLKKKGGIAAILSILGVGGGILGGFFGPATMLINLHDNLIETNDSLGPSYERRFRKTFNHMIGDSDATCSSKKVRCRMGTPSYKALDRLSKNGIRALDSNGDPIDTTQKGYPSVKPARYELDDLDNPGRKKYVDAKDLDGFLKSNYKYAAKVYGRYGAFKLRTKAWTGKHIKKLFNKIGISRAGGIVKEKIDLTKGKLSDQISKLRAKVLSKVPNLNVENRVLEMLQKFIKSAAGKGGGGAGAGLQYKTAIASCLALKAPKMITSAAVMIQLAQIAPYIMDFVLSPGSKAKAAGFGSGFTGEDANAVGTILTERIPRKSDGKPSSVLDSEYLLQAIGVNKNKSAKSSFAPGHTTGLSSFLANAAKDIEEVPALEESCDFLMTPAGYYSAVIANQTINAALAGGTVGVGFLGKMVVDIAGSLAIDGTLTLIADKALPTIYEDYIRPAMEWLFENSNLEGARGEELGDALGISASVFFSTGNMHGGLSTLTTDQLQAFNDMKQENEEYNRKLEVASLSPFDTSSKYTFLGSILYNTRQMMLANGSYNDSFSSIIGNILRLPSYALSFNKAAKASVNSGMSCSYADDYGFNGTNDGKVPAINVAGMPCTGLTPEQDSMSTTEALDLLEESGWIDPSKEDSLSEGADIEEMVQKKYIKDGEVLADFIQACTDATNGQYAMGVAGCTVPSNTSDKKLAAMSVFLIDYTLAQTINGENEEPEEKTGSQVSASGDIVKAGEMFLEYTYQYGGHFHGSVEDMKKTIEDIKNGSLAKGSQLTDCTGFVRASIYAATGFDIVVGTTSTYDSYIGKTIDEISLSDLRPGDIAWREGHVEIVTKVEGGQVYTQGARGPENGGPIGGPLVLGDWTRYFRAKV